MNLESLKILSSIFVIGFAIVVSLLSCSDSKNTTSIAPELSILGEYLYDSGNGYDSFILVDLEYSDGDGDIGLSESDTLGEFAYRKSNFYNLYCWYLEKKNGRWVQPMNPLSVKDTLNLHERLPNLTPSGRNKSIHGTINFNISARPNQYRGDTVKFRFQLVDRALHRSKMVETKIFTLKHP